MEPVISIALELPGQGQGNLVQALHQQLRAAIVDGRLAANAPLPSSRQLANALGVARNTVVAAFDLLIAEGYLRSRRGRLAQVANIAGRRPPKASVNVLPLRDSQLAERWRTGFPADPPRIGLPERCFRLGIPDHRHFPHEIWRRLAAQTLRDWARTPFGYSPSEGIPALRMAIANHVAFARAVACRAEDVLVTSGAQQAFDLLARALVTPGKTRVAFEEPGYPPARAAFLAAGAQLVAVPLDDEGLCVAQLPDDIGVVFVTPSHQSPTGVALSLRRRAALLAFARARQAVIIEDDYDGEFRFGGRPLDALQTLDRDGRVFYVGTFSKSLFPALRKGFIVAPPWAHEALVAIKQCADSHCDTITQSVLAAFIRDGHLARHVRRMRPIYAARRAALLDGIRRELGPWLEPIPAEAGLHLAARIRDPGLATRIAAQARLHLPGSQSTAEYALRPLDNPALVIGYGVADAEAIPVALSRLRAALKL